MRMYSSDELDVMAEAYLKALDKLPVESPTIELTQRLFEEIGANQPSENDVAVGFYRRGFHSTRDPLAAIQLR